MQCELITTQSSLYLSYLIPPKLNSLRHPNTYSVMRCRKGYFKNSFTTDVVREWNQLSTEIRNSTSYQQFRKSFFSFIKLTCLTLFSISLFSVFHLRNHKFKHNFLVTLNPLCYCGLDPETTSHYLLCCNNFSSARSALMNDLNLIDPSISQFNEIALASTAT